MRTLLVLVLSVLFFSVAQAQQGDLIDRTFSGTSKETNPQEARRDIQEQAAQKVSEEIVKELIGQDRFNRHRSLIQSKVVKNSARYIPYSKPSALSQDGAEFKMSVEMKVSLRDLKQLLQENALLNENDAIPVVLPTIAWIDRVEGRSYRWWIPGDRNAQTFLVKNGRLLESALRDSFQKNNFYVIRPIEAGLGANVPADFQSEKISSENGGFFAQYFNAPVMIDGQVLLSKADSGRGYKIEIRMTAVQVSNGRAIADVSRRYETPAGNYESAVDKRLREVVETASNDLASQVLEASQRGSLGTSVLRVTVAGRSSIPQMEALKEKIRSQLTQVKGIRERLVSAESVSFEVDTALPPDELASKIETLEVNGKRLAKVSEQKNEIVFKWAQ